MGFSSAQIIALCRLVLASVFLLAIYIDPTQPVATPEYGYALLGVYALFSLALLFVAISSWRHDHAFARGAHVLDLAMFGAVVFITEGYTSPFFTFSVFLLLSASIRWSWRETAWTALAVNVLYLGSGTLALAVTPVELDIQRLLIRSTYLIVLSALFILFALNAERGGRRRGEAGAASVPSGAGAGLVEAILARACARTEAGTVMLVWREEDEPMGRIARLDENGLDNRPVAAETVEPLIAFQTGQPQLVDVPQRHLLPGVAGGAGSRLEPEVARALAAQGIDQALAIPIAAGGIEGVVFATDIAHLAIDHLATGAALVEEFARMAEDSAFARLSQEATETRVRFLLARDLHDSLAQFLAGVSFRLEALRRSQRSPAEIREDIARFQDELTCEQDHLRELIADLRGGTGEGSLVDLSLRLPHLLRRLGAQWGVEVTLACERGLLVSSADEIELHQMIREGISNAVRHGGADCVEIALRPHADGLELQIVDNGSGLGADADGTPAMPRSLNDRAAALGGRMTVIEQATGADIVLTLPMGTAR